MRILGISALYHDSAAALIVDGDIVAAAQEERFTRRKHDPGLPARAIRYCLATAAIEARDLDAVCYYENPLLVLDRWLKNSIAEGNRAEGIVEKTFERFFSDRLWVHDRLRESLGGFGKHGKLLVCEHHTSHAASAFFPSPFESAAVLTLDGVGEWATTTIGTGCAHNITVLKQINYPHSLGLLYSAVTYFCGFKVNSGEYKLMGLAPYGKPVFYDLIREKLIDVKPDGSFRLKTDFFAFTHKNTMTDDHFGGLFAEPRRKPEQPITQREMDLAASVQKVTEEIVVQLARTAQQITGSRNLCLAGGVALNCVANGQLLRQRLFDDIWIQPAAGDAGTAVGCALYAYHTLFGKPRSPTRPDSQHGSYLGPVFSDDQIDAFLKERGAPFRRFDDKQSLAREVAMLVSQDRAIGLFSGRMEFGPRALGSRSIVANPMSPQMQSRLNLKIKFRESFRPFAPAVLAEKAAMYFAIDRPSPYMLLVAPVRDEIRRAFDLEAFIDRTQGDMLPIVNEPRSTIPAVTHVDYSARVQTVSAESNPFLRSLLQEFDRLTGCPVIINTSFNVRGEPIVCSPEDAYMCFMRTGLDALVLENCLLLKEEQPAIEEDTDWRAAYELD